MFPYQRLAVWKKSHDLSVALLKDQSLDAQPAAWVIAGQLRRAALSVAANIAEGAGSESQAMFARYLAIALASSHETEYLLLAALDSGVLPAEAHEVHAASIVEIKKMLTGLLRSVRKKPVPPATPPENEQRPQNP